ncbi:hypothetical protein JTB14_019163 [Gonioctena quinquepunctata]|nr:hypothetical protein JTB14_019163 [Gonioctena quinquepunctata]
MVRVSEMVEQVGGDDEAVEDGGVPAAADIIKDLASRFQDLTMEQTDGCAECYTITFVVSKNCVLCASIYIQLDIAKQMLYIDT